MRIQTKLFLTLLLTSVALVGTMVILTQWSVDRGMLAYVNQRDAEQLQPVLLRLAEHYAERKNWQAIENRRAFDLLVGGKNFGRGTPRGRPPGPPGAHPPRRGTAAVVARGYVDPRDTTLLDANGDVVSGRSVTDIDTERHAITVDNQIVGWLVRNRQKKITDGFELQFLEQQQLTLLAISALVLLLSGIISFILARHLLRPIGHLTAAAARLTSGNYRIEPPLERKDELGQLARDFNELAHTLDANETSRQRWFADISHELRTPLSILQGEIEAMLDGVRPITAKQIQSLADEVGQLSRLIEDLYELSNSDVGALKYRKAELDIVELVGNAVEHHRSRSHEQGLSFDYDNKINQSLELYGDETRLRQLLDNLLDNSCKYTNPGGRIQLVLAQDVDRVVIEIQDSAPGVNQNQLHRLFEYLYRGEQSRNRKTGGSGLGLAICQRIVEGHQGRISAEQSTLGGLTVTITLPIDNG